MNAALSFSLALQNVGKRFYGRWLFKNLSFSLVRGEKIALIGTNGAGKSTLMRIMAGQLAPSEGKCFYSKGKTRISSENMHQCVSWAGPQLQLYTDFTLTEHLRVHFQFKTCLLSSIEEVIVLLKLENEADKKLRFFSSGMLQRVKIGLALFSKGDLLLLDEPTANMDEENASYVLELIEKYRGDRVYVLASNLEREYRDFSHIKLISS